MNGIGTKVVAGVVAAAAVAGGGAALAANQLGSPKADSQAIVNDVAKQLGVTPAKLTNALKAALADRVEAAVADGRLTKAQGDELKARIASGDVPLLGLGPVGGHFRGGPGGHLDATATYLGLKAAELGTQLESGKTLAQVAAAEGKTVDGLVAALVADEKKELDAAVQAGRLTAAQAKELLANAKQRFAEMVNGTGGPGFGHGPGGPGGFGGFLPLPSSPSTSTSSDDAGAPA
jgi:hypothetical protein